MACTLDMIYHVPILKSAARQGPTSQSRRVDAVSAQDRVACLAIAVGNARSRRPIPRLARHHHLGTVQHASWRPRLISQCCYVSLTLSLSHTLSLTLSLSHSRSLSRSYSHSATKSVPYRLIKPIAWCTAAHPPLPSPPFPPHTLSQSDVKSADLNLLHTERHRHTHRHRHTQTHTDT